MMTSDLFIGLLVSFINFGIHAVLTALIVVTTRRAESRTHHHGIFVRLTALLTVSVTILMFAHIAEIALWAAALDLLGIQIVNVGVFEFVFEPVVSPMTKGVTMSVPFDRLTLCSRWTQWAVPPTVSFVLVMRYRALAAGSITGACRSTRPPTTTTRPRRTR